MPLNKLATICWHYRTKPSHYSFRLLRRLYQFTAMNAAKKTLWKCLLVIFWWKSLVWLDGGLWWFLGAAVTLWGPTYNREPACHGTDNDVTEEINTPFLRHQGSNSRNIGRIQMQWIISYLSLNINSTWPLRIETLDPQLFSNNSLNSGLIAAGKPDVNSSGAVTITNFCSSYYFLAFVILRFVHTLASFI